ncbi:MAG: tRNA (adenosine(37)-N6)-dimethylallyltransferase MiaA [Proteobacteria bacterium]|nr:tRNA (adenosine(37)-N6)-dimethylallyltransferase MiaA [Pseudomonadota bacterium]
MTNYHPPQTHNMQGKIVIICGPTASGKSQYALDLAINAGNGVIINADSMQVYRFLPILTAQATAQQQANCPHKLYSIINPDEHFSVARWLELAKKEIEQALTNNQTPIIVGGTGMYISSLINGLAQVPAVPLSIVDSLTTQTTNLSQIELHQLLMQCDPAAAAKIKVGDRQRALRAIAVYKATGQALTAWQTQTTPYYPRTQLYIIGILPDRELVYRNCNSRFLEMLATGAIEEVRWLTQHYPHQSYPKVLGLNEICQYLDGFLTWGNMIAQAQQYTRNYAKRQYTWFRNQITFYDMIVTN